jgi:hypothetical protein
LIDRSARIKEMAMKKALVPILIMAAAPSLGIQERGARPVKVYVTGKTGVQPPSKNERKALEKELEKKTKETLKVLKDLEKQLKKQYGKDPQQWPEDAQLRFKAALKDDWIAVQALAELDYRSCKQKDIDKKVRNLKKAFVGEIRRSSPDYAGFSQTDEFRTRMRTLRVVRMADSQEEVDLTVEVLAKRRCRDRGYSFWREFRKSFSEQFAAGLIPVAADEELLERRALGCVSGYDILLLKLKPGKRLSPACISAIDQQLKSRDTMTVAQFEVGVSMVRPYEEDEPFWVFEVAALSEVARGKRGVLTAVEEEDVALIIANTWSRSCPPCS